MEKTSITINRLLNTIVSICCFAISAFVAFIGYEKGKFLETYLIVGGLPLAIAGIVFLFQRNIVVIEPHSESGKISIALDKKLFFWTRAGERYVIPIDDTFTIKRRFSHGTNKEVFYPIVMWSGNELITCKTKMGARRVCKLVQKHIDITIEEEQYD